MALLPLMLILFFSTRADSRLTEKTVPSALTPGFDHLLTMADLHKPGDFDPRRVKPLLDFVTSPSDDPALFCADTRQGASSAYHHFELRAGLDRILRYAYNSRIPSQVFTPSSTRLARWSHPQSPGTSATAPPWWEELPRLDKPVIFRAVEHEENTPDLFTGSYYDYDLNRAFVLFRHRGRPVFISVSQQNDTSGVGRKGAVLGADGNWDYFYSGKPGLNMVGLGWVKPRMYKSFSIAVFCDMGTRTPLVRCGVFKWLKAGWAGLNVVNTRHIHQGLVRFSEDFKGLIEDPRLPEPDTMARHFVRLDGLTDDQMREALEPYFDNLRRCYGQGEELEKPEFAHLLDTGNYLAQMNREGMRGLLIIEALKCMLGRKPLAGTGFCTRFVPDRPAGQETTAASTPAPRSQ